YRTIEQFPMPLGPFRLNQTPMAVMFFGSDRGMNNPPGHYVARNYGFGFMTLVPPFFNNPRETLDVRAQKLTTVFTDSRTGRQVTLGARQLPARAINPNVPIQAELTSIGSQSRKSEIGIYLREENPPNGAPIVVPGFLADASIRDAMNPNRITTFSGVW